MPVGNRRDVLLSRTCLTLKSECFLFFFSFSFAILTNYRESGDSWVQELEEDVSLKVSEDYGKVLHIHVDPSSKQGEVYIKFEKVEQGERALLGLNGRYFGGKMLVAMAVVEMVYSLKFPKS